MCYCNCEWERYPEGSNESCICVKPRGNNCCPLMGCDTLSNHISTYIDGYTDLSPEHRAKALEAAYTKLGIKPT